MPISYTLRVESKDSLELPVKMVFHFEDQPSLPVTQAIHANEIWPEDKITIFLGKNCDVNTFLGEVIDGVFIPASDISVPDFSSSAHIPVFCYMAVDVQPAMAL